MISLSSSGARKDLGLGFTGRAGKMDETEVEDGEASSYSNCHSSDSRIDPDTALSYIDEKLENVLGHFQKDFEGGVSAENLGAKFGGYGSFLPMYQLSPGRSQPKSPLKVQKLMIPRSPNNSSLEGGPSNSSVSTTARQVVISTTTLKDCPSKVLVKLKECDKSSNCERSDSKQEFTAKSSCSTSSNQKNLRVRIKVGSNGLTSRKNVSAYGEQGLGPSTLLEKSLSENEEGFLGGLDDSPTTILMAMISFPLHKDMLLSPLSDDLIQLGEKEGLMNGDNRYFCDAKLDAEKTHVLMDVSDSQKCDTKFSIVKKEKLTGTVKYVPLSNRPDRSCIGTETDKETDTQSCEELVSKTLRLPLLSCLSPMYTHPTKGISKVSDAYLEAVEGTIRGVIRSDLEEAVIGLKPGLEQNVVAFSAESVNKAENVTCLNRTGKDLNSKGEILTMISESKSKKAPNAEHIASSMDKFSKRETGSNLRKKSRESSSSIVPAVERLRDDSAVKKNKKNAHANKLQEGVGRSEDRYKKIVDDMGESKEEIKSSPVDKVAKEKLSRHNASGERLNDKKTEKLLHSQPQLPTPLGNAPPSTCRSISDAARAASASTLIEDNWVLCEKCQKWRLLPNGMNPDNFPEDWECSMLSWLPGMNSCTVHQDLTTEAVLRMHRIPPLEVQETMNRNPGSAKSLISGQAFQNLGQGKERKGLKEITSGTDKETRNHLPLVSEPDSTHLTKSSDSSTDRRKIKQNDSCKVSNQQSGEGEMKNSRMEIERDLDRDLSGISKKPKTGTSQSFNVDRPRSNKLLKGVASDKTDRTQASATEVKENANTSLYYGCDNRDVLRKRKLKENQEIGDHVTALSVEKIKKQKSLMVSSSDGKESHVDSGNAELDRGVSQATDKDFACHLPSMATDSSSYKLSCLFKTKTNFQEGKGSPVEWVSSSPSKMLDPDKLNSGRTNLLGKDEPHNTKSSANAGIQRCSDGESYNRTDRSKTTKKKQILVLDNDVHCLSSGKVMGQVVHSAVETDPHDKNRKLDDLDENIRYSRNLKTEQSSDNERQYDENYRRGKSQTKESGELSSAPSKEKNQDMVFVSEVEGLATAGEVKPNEGRSKNIPAGKVTIESSKEDSREYQDPNAKSDAKGSPHYAYTRKPDTPKTFSGKSVQGEMTSGKVKNKRAQPFGSGQMEVLGQGSDVLNRRTQMIGHEDQKVAQDICLRNPSRNGNRLKDHNSLSSLKKGSSSQSVSNSIKEATDLKHMADRLKNAGLNLESTSSYFQAALKFLYGATLLESSPEHSKHKSIVRSRQIYDSTAKLCEFCAHEYEKFKDMGAAALAYKCVEVAYLRIIYSSHGNMSRYRYELQAALPVIPSGESPSATDVENLNHTSSAEKVSSSNVMRSPKVTGNQFISSKNHSYLSQLLAFSQNVISAMDASRKAQIAFAAAKGKSVNARYSSDGLSSIKRALDFNFQDMEGLLHVVRLAIEAINS